MKNRIALISICALGVIAAVYCVLQPREPEFKGHPLSYWLSAGVSDSGEEQNAKAAVKEAGTNAIPVLLKMLKVQRSESTSSSSFRSEVRRFLGLPWLPAGSYYARAEFGFSILGGTASNAVPSLIRIYKEDREGSAKVAVLQSLGWIGRPAIGAMSILLEAGTIPDASLQSVAMMALGRVDDLSSTNGIAVLMEGLRDPSVHVRRGATYAFNNLPYIPETARQRLEEGLRDSDSYVRHHSAIALGRFGAMPDSTFQDLLHSLEDSDEWTQLEAVRSILKFKPNEAAARAVLERLRKSENEMLQERIAKVFPQVQK